MTDPQQHTQDGPDQEQVTANLDLAGSVTALVSVFNKGMADEMKPYDVRPIEFSLLRHCLDNEDCNATELAEILPVDASRISRIVTGLVDRGLLLRHRQPEDRRVVTLQLSNEGKVLVSLLLQRMNTYVSRLLRNVGDEEMCIFESVTEKLIANHRDLRSAN